MRNKVQPAIMLYREFFSVFRSLDGDAVKELLLAMEAFVYDDVRPVLRDELIPLWSLLEHRLLSDSERYKEVSTKNQVNGLISCYKRSYASAHGLDPAEPRGLAAFLHDRNVSDDIILSSTGIDWGEEASTTVDGRVRIQPTTATTKPQQQPQQQPQ